MNKDEFLHKYLVDRHGTCCSKWDGLKAKFGETDLISMWIADMEFKSCDAIVKVLTEKGAARRLWLQLCAGFLLPGFFQLDGKTLSFSFAEGMGSLYHRLCDRYCLDDRNFH
jgi:hypothetical protein